MRCGTKVVRAPSKLRTSENPQKAKFAANLVTPHSPTPMRGISRSPIPLIARYYRQVAWGWAGEELRAPGRGYEGDELSD